MGRVKIQDLRRRELIDATIRSIHKHGFADLTVAQISLEAGVSGGSIHYYFGGKTELLEATMRFFLNSLRQICIHKLRAAPTADQRLRAVVLSNFDPLIFQPQTVTAWVQFWAQAPYSAPLRRLQAINAARVRSNLRHELKLLIPQKNADAAAGMIQISMDGIWIRYAQKDMDMNGDEAATMALAGIDAALRLHG